MIKDYFTKIVGEVTDTLCACGNYLLRQNESECSVCRVFREHINYGSPEELHLLTARTRRAWIADDGALVLLVKRGV